MVAGHIHACNHPDIVFRLAIVWFTVDLRISRLSALYVERGESIGANLLAP
jgi:hypothetical protein